MSRDLPPVPGLEHVVFPPELVRFMSSKAGLRRAFRQLEFLMLWGMVADKLGREPTRQEYCDEWGESEGTYFRRLANWRSVWPEDSSPQRVWEWRRSVIAEEAVGRRLAT